MVEAKMRIVSKSAANRCPYCEVWYSTNIRIYREEGGKTITRCPACGEEYAYYTDGKQRIFVNEDGNLYMVDEDGIIFHLQPFNEDEDGDGYILDPTTMRTMITL